MYIILYICEIADIDPTETNISCGINSLAPHASVSWETKLLPEPILTFRQLEP